MQTRLSSLRESIDNILIGYVVAVISQILIFPMFGVHVTVTDNLTIAGYFTVISIARSYAIRRWKNKKTVCPNCGFCKDKV